jgi:two-component system OmpR family sensor kinase
MRNRYIVIREVEAVLLLPVLLQFPAVAALVWWLIGYGFGPLLRVSRMIRSRTPAFLDPLPPGDVPEEIASLVAALNDLLAALRQAIAMQARFTADAAHELRTPLTAVKLQLDVLGRARSEGEREEAQQALQRGVERSMRLVGQLLELARQEPGAFAQEPPQALDLDLAAANAIELLEPLARHRNITLAFLPGGGRIAADGAAIEVLAGNLISNALLYTPAGGRVAVRTLPVAGGRVVLEVADSGKGIPKDERVRVFDRFYRLPGSETVGSGLGLSIVRTIAERHDAVLSVEEGLDNAAGGKGACFRVSFPAS